MAYSADIDLRAFWSHYPSPAAANGARKASSGTAWLALKACGANGHSGTSMRTRARISLQRKRRVQGMSLSELESALKAMMEKLERNWALSTALILVAIVALSSFSE